MSGPRLPALTEDAVLVVWFDLARGVDVATALSVLDPGERERAARFVCDTHRRTFIITHALVRLYLGYIRHVAPEAVRFAIGSHGKPRLEVDADLRFSLSHSGERAVLAVSPNREVGVDVEQERTIDALELARHYFSPREYAALASLPAREVNPAFFRCWTRKESFLKALGLGLSYPIEACEVGIAPSPICHVSHDTVAAERTWSTVSLDAAPGYAAALTAEGVGWTVDAVAGEAPWRWQVEPAGGRRSVTTLGASGGARSDESH